MKQTQNDVLGKLGAEIIEESEESNVRRFFAKKKAARRTALSLCACAAVVFALTFAVIPLFKNDVVSPPEESAAVIEESKDKSKEESKTEDQSIEVRKEEKTEEQSKDVSQEDTSTVETSTEEPSEERSEIERKIIYSPHVHYSAGEEVVYPGIIKFEDSTLEEAINDPENTDALFAVVFVIEYYPSYSADIETQKQNIIDMFTWLRTTYRQTTLEGTGVKRSCTWTQLYEEFREDLKTKPIFETKHFYGKYGNEIKEVFQSVIVAAQQNFNQLREYDKSDYLLWLNENIYNEFNALINSFKPFENPETADPDVFADFVNRLYDFYNEYNDTIWNEYTQYITDESLTAFNNLITRYSESGLNLTCCLRNDYCKTNIYTAEIAKEQLEILTDKNFGIMIYFRPENFDLETFVLIE